MQGDQCFVTLMPEIKKNDIDFLSNSKTFCSLIDINGVIENRQERGQFCFQYQHFSGHYLVRFQELTNFKFILKDLYFFKSEVKKIYIPSSSLSALSL